MRRKIIHCEKRDAYHLVTVIKAQALKCSHFIVDGALDAFTSHQCQVPAGIGVVWFCACDANAMLFPLG